METYIAILLLIVPGFIARDFFEKLNKATVKNFEFDSIVTSLIYSVFVIALDFLYLFVFGGYKVNDISSVVALFGTNRFVLRFIIVTLINSLYVALIWTLFRPYYLKGINFVRNLLGHNSILDATSLLDILSVDSGHTLKIERGGGVDYGFLENISRNESGKIDGITLYEGKRLKDTIGEYGDENIAIKRIYHMFDPDFIITEFDTDQLQSKKVTHKMQLFLLGTSAFFVLQVGILLISALI